MKEWVAVTLTMWLMYFFGANEGLILMFAILGVLIIVLVLRNRKKAKKQADLDAIAPNPFDRGRRLADEYGWVGRWTTPKGMQVQKEASVSEADVKFALTAFDEGATESFRRAEYCEGLAKFGAPYMKHEDYIVQVWESVKTPNGNYAIRVPALNYTGHPDFDPDSRGWIYAGAILLAPNGWEVNHVMKTRKGVLAVPDTKSDSQIQSALGVQHELEHAILAKYDLQRYIDTQTHGVGQGHPLFANCASKEDQPDALMSEVGKSAGVAKHAVMKSSDGQYAGCVICVE